MIKKLMKVLFCMLVIALAIYVFLGHNLKSNAVFYAQHTPHKEGLEPVLIEVVSELDWIYTPDIPGIRYDIDGSRVIINANYRPGQDGPSSFGKFSGPSYCYDDGGPMYYDFDQDFNLTIVIKGLSEKIDPQSIKVDEIKTEIYHVVQPVIDAQPTPIINLQWLYDIVNHDRFN